MAVSTVDLLVDQKYNPVFQDSITSKTKLASGISMAKFLGGDNDPVTLTHITDDNQKVLPFNPINSYTTAKPLDIK